MKTNFTGKINREQMLLINLSRALNEAAREIAIGLQFGLNSNSFKSERTSRDLIEKKMFNITVLMAMLEKENILSSDWYNTKMFEQEIRHIEKLLNVSQKKQIMTNR